MAAGGFKMVGCECVPSNSERAEYFIFKTLDFEAVIKRNQSGVVLTDLTLCFAER